MSEESKRRKVVPLRPVHDDAPWASDLVWRATSSGWRAAPNVANAIVILTRDAAWRGAIAYDEFAERIVTLSPCPVLATPGVWRDVHDVETAAWLQRSRWRLDVGVETAGVSVRAVAQQRRVHPLRQRVAAVDWDGVARVDTWLSLYLAAPENEYTRQVGARWLVSAIARLFTPGSKADHVLVLEGPQGRKKSTALRALALGYFTDEVADLGSKDSAMQLAGVWIVELAELDALARADVARVKAFVSRTVDRFRPPYGRHVEDRPRQCVFAGSTNEGDYLKDASGGRRFWPVQCGNVDVGALERDVSQLWAEALVRYRRGETWWLDTSDAVERASSEQAARYQGDAWDAGIDAYVAGHEYVTLPMILGQHLQLEPSKWDQQGQNRVARSLRSLGWVRRQVRAGHVREWRYYPPTSPASRVAGHAGDVSGDTENASNIPTVTSHQSVTTRYNRDYGSTGETLQRGLMGKGVTAGDVVTDHGQEVAAENQKGDPESGVDASESGAFTAYVAANGIARERDDA